MSLCSGGRIIGRIFASEICGGGGLLSGGLFFGGGSSFRNLKKQGKQLLNRTIWSNGRVYFKKYNTTHELMLKGNCHELRMCELSIET